MLHVTNAHLRVGRLPRCCDGRGHKAARQLLKQLLQQHALLGAKRANDHQRPVGRAYDIRHVLAERGAHVAQELLHVAGLRVNQVIHARAVGHLR